MKNDSRYCLYYFHKLFRKYTGYGLHPIGHKHVEVNEVHSPGFHGGYQSYVIQPTPRYTYNKCYIIRPTPRYTYNKCFIILPIPRYTYNKCYIILPTSRFTYNKCYIIWPTPRYTYNKCYDLGICSSVVLLFTNWCNKSKCFCKNVTAVPFVSKYNFSIKFVYKLRYIIIFVYRRK